MTDRPDNRPLIVDVAADNNSAISTQAFLAYARSSAAPGYFGRPSAPPQEPTYAQSQGELQGQEYGQEAPSPYQSQEYIQRSAANAEPDYYQAQLPGDVAQQPPTLPSQSLTPWRNLWNDQGRAADSGQPLSPVNRPILTPGMGISVIPSLKPGLPASEQNRSFYPATSDIATLATDNQNSIVQISGPGKNNPNVGYTGSGFFVDREGDIATAYHVVKDMQQIYVTTADGRRHDAHIANFDPTDDIAVIAISPSEGAFYKPVALATTSDDLKAGDQMAVLGHPKGWPKLYVSPGSFQKRTTLGDIQTSDAQGQNPETTLLVASMNVQGGDSGGAAFDSQGRVVGIADRGDGGKHGWMTSVNDLWPLLSNSAIRDQAALTGEAVQLPQRSELPSSLHFSSAEAFPAILASQVALGLGSRGMAGLVGTGAAWLSAINFGFDFRQTDLPFFNEAMATGTTREKIDAAINIAADGLVAGGALFSTFGRTRGFGLAASLLGTTLKVGNEIAAYRPYS